MRLLLAFILALLPMPALADVTARYAAGKDVLLVEADNGGNSRIGIEGKFGIIRRDGVDYVITVQPSGATQVTELAELLSLMSGAMKERLETPTFPINKFLLVAKGEALVGNRKGMMWHFGPETQPNEKSEKQLEVVISADPALAPIAAIFRRTVEALLPVFGAMIPQASGFSAMAMELVGKGAPLSVDKLITLQSVDSAEIDPKRFELPSPVLSAAEFLGAMDAGGAEFTPLP